MGKYVAFFLVFSSSCSLFQVKPTVTEEKFSDQTAVKTEKPESRSDRVRKLQNRAILKKIIGLATNFQKPVRGFTQKQDPAKVFNYTAKFKSNNREGAVSLEIKPEGDKFRFNCKIVIETLSQEETLDFTSLDAAEIVRQIKIVLGDEGYVSD